MSALDRILRSYRNESASAREQGTYFERLALAFLTHDSVQVQQYSSVQTYKDWANENGEDARDIGIDLVAKLRDERGYAAIQCKFFSPQHRIQKSDIDSFLSASSRNPFVRRVFIDTTEVDWSDNADATIANQSIPVVRIGLTALRESAIDWGSFEVTEKVSLQPKKTLLTHQKEAVEHVTEGFAKHDRGKSRRFSFNV